MCNVKEAHSSLGGLRESWEVVALGTRGLPVKKAGVYLVDVAQWIQFQAHVRRMSTCIYRTWGQEEYCVFTSVGSGDSGSWCVYTYLPRLH